MISTLLLTAALCQHKPKHDSEGSVLDLMISAYSLSIYRLLKAYKWEFAAVADCRVTDLTYAC